MESTRARSRGVDSTLARSRDSVRGDKQVIFLKLDETNIDKNRSKLSRVTKLFNEKNYFFLVWPADSSDPYWNK